jgi:predicted transcriptional regulator
MSIKIDAETRRRIEHLAAAHHRTPHWLMREAIRQYVDREDKREAFRQATLQAWDEYEETGLHIKGMRPPPLLLSQKCHHAYAGNLADSLRSTQNALHGINEMGKRLSGGKQNDNEQKRVDRGNDLNAGNGCSNQEKYGRYLDACDIPGYNGRSPRSVDVQSFVIAGLKLGMDPEQAIAIVAGYFKVSPKALTIGYYAKKDIEPPFKSVRAPIPRGNPNSRNDTITYYETKALTGGEEMPSKFPRSLSYEKGGVKLVVIFAKRVHVDKNHPVAVNNIQYSIPRSKQNYDEMFQSALTKYGPPSAANAQPKLGYRLSSWCENPTPSIVDRSGSRAAVCLSPGTGIPKSRANYKKLNLQEAKLTLFDSSLEDGFAEFRASFTNPATKPNF